MSDEHIYVIDAACADRLRRLTRLLAQALDEMLIRRRFDLPGQLDFGFDEVDLEMTLAESGARGDDD